MKPKEETQKFDLKQALIDMRLEADMCSSKRVEEIADRLCAEIEAHMELKKESK